MHLLPCRLAVVAQAPVFAVPLLLLFHLLEMRLVLPQLLAGGVKFQIQRFARFGGQWRDTGGLVLPVLELLAGVAALFEGAFAQARIERGVGELFQQFAAFVVVGFEKGTEFALRQHHRTGELLEVQPQAGFQQLLVFTFLAGEQLVIVQIAQRLPAVLQLARRFVPCPVGLPARAIATTVDAEEIHFRIARPGTPTQQGARVVAADFTVGVGHLGTLRRIAQARYGAKQRQAQGVEQGALARAGGAGDGEQTGAGQRFGGEVQFERACQRGEVLQADGQNLHGVSPSSCTSCNNCAKSSRVCSSTSLP
ncbi:hypothetical protein ABMD26_003760 [Pseudomonas sp. PvP001]